jgi:predicted transglutaminase-like cysteine proteinase
MFSGFRGFRGLAVATIITLAGVTGAEAQQTSGLPVASAPIVAGGDARAPYAWVDFCKRMPSECAVDTREAEQIELTAKTWKLIVAANVKANREHRGHHRPGPLGRGSTAGTFRPTARAIARIMSC